MGRKRIGIILITSLIVTGVPWANVSYAAERDDILIETYETVPAAGYESELSEEETVPEGVVSETLATTPVSDEVSEGADQEEARPEGVVSMTLKTTAVESEGEENDPDKDTGKAGSKHEGTEATEVTGRSSMPDPAEIGMYAEDVINMVMPVVADETYDFVMDSDDLLSRFSDNKDEYEAASIYFNNTSGAKSHTNTSDVAMAKNKSSVPVLLYVTFQVENNYGWPVNFTDMDSVEADDGKNISFAIIPVSSNDVGEADDTDAEASDSRSEEGLEAGKDTLQDENAVIEEEGAEEALAEEEVLLDDEAVGDTADRTSADDKYRLFRDKMISIDENGRAEMILYLPGTPDNFDVMGDKYLAKEDAVWSSLGFAITGACNRNADWREVDDRSALGENIGIHISYRMDLLTEEQQAWIDEGHGPDPETGIITFDD